MRSLTVLLGSRLVILSYRSATLDKLFATRWTQFSHSEPNQVILWRKKNRDNQHYLLVTNYLLNMGNMLWDKLCPLKRFGEVLTPSISELKAIFENRVWCRYNSSRFIKLRLGGPLMQYEWCPYWKRRESETATQWEHHVMMEIATGAKPPQGRGHSRLPATIRS